MNPEQIHFEKARMRVLGVIDMRKNTDGSYVDFDTQEAWLLWQAALKPQANSEPVLYAVPDFDEICKERNGCTLCSKEPSDLHTEPLYTTPQPPQQADKIRELEKELELFRAATPQALHERIAEIMIEAKAMKGE